MRDLLEQLSVQFDSYPWGGWGNSPVLSDGDKDSRRWVEQTRGLQRAVNPEQASKVHMCPPTRHQRGEGRCVPGKQPTRALGAGTGVMGAAREEGSPGNVGNPEWGAGSRPQRHHGWRPCRNSERPMVPMKPGKARRRDGALLQERC